MGGGSIIVWGGMAAGGAGSLVLIDIMDKFKYLNILKDHLLDQIKSSVQFLLPTRE